MCVPKNLLGNDEDYCFCTAYVDDEMAIKTQIAPAAHHVDHLPLVQLMTAAPRYPPKDEQHPRWDQDKLVNAIMTDKHKQ